MPIQAASLREDYLSPLRDFEAILVSSNKAGLQQVQRDFLSHATCMAQHP